MRAVHNHSVTNEHTGIEEQLSKLELEQEELEQLEKLREYARKQEARSSSPYNHSSPYFY